MDEINLRQTVPKRFERGRAKFGGWYFKQQNANDTVALIPAFHTDENGVPSASLQVITANVSAFVQFKAEQFLAGKRNLLVRLGNNVFSRSGCRLDAASDSITLSGDLRFGALRPPAHDVMGPLRFAPFMECRHHVYSLSHRVDGTLKINGQEILFKNGTGYLEGDSGKSFPRRYVWTQWGQDGNCVMLSAAEIPACGRSFTGCVGIVYWEDQEYRIASYLGARLFCDRGDAVYVRQGKLEILAEMRDKGYKSLYAPVLGGMTRSIRENAACRVHYRCTLGDRVLFDFTAENASYEDNWAQNSP